MKNAALSIDIMDGCSDNFGQFRQYKEARKCVIDTGIMTEGAVLYKFVTNTNVNILCLL